MPDFGKLQKEPLSRAYCVIQWLFLVRGLLLHQAWCTQGFWEHMGWVTCLGLAEYCLDPGTQDTSQWSRWNLTFANVKYIPSNKWSLFLLLMLKIFVTLDIFNFCKRGHWDTVRIYKEKQEFLTLCGSLFINVWTYATRCSIQQMTM